MIKNVVTQSKLIENVCAVHDELSKKHIKEIIGCYFEFLKDSVALCAYDTDVKTPIGTLKVRESKAHKGRNPQTGEPIVIPAKQRLTLKAKKGIV